MSVRLIREAISSFASGINVIGRYKTCASFEYIEGCVRTLGAVEISDSDQLRQLQVMVFFLSLCGDRREKSFCLKEVIMILTKSGLASFLIKDL